MIHINSINLNIPQPFGLKLVQLDSGATPPSPYGRASMPYKPQPRPWIDTEQSSEWETTNLRCGRRKCCCYLTRSMGGWKTEINEEEKASRWAQNYGAMGEKDALLMEVDHDAMKEGKAPRVKKDAVAKTELAGCDSQHREVAGVDYF
jgi:hypothetical protein